MTVWTIEVQGMTCSHCEAAITQELRDGPGLEVVGIELDPQGISRVTLEAPADRPDQAGVREAVSEAGFELVGTS